MTCWNSTLRTEKKFYLRLPPPLSDLDAALNSNTKRSGTHDFETVPISVSTYPGSPSMVIREPNIALAVLLGRAEHSACQIHPPPSTQLLLERSCRAVVAYGAICQMLSVVSNTIMAQMVSLSFTADGVPYFAFGSTIAYNALIETTKEELRILRDEELRGANPTTTFKPAPLARTRGPNLGHCAEVPSLFQICPQIRDAITRKVDVFTVAVSPQGLSGVCRSTKKPWWVGALDFEDGNGFHKAVKLGKAYRPACANCEQMLGELFPSGRVTDLGKQYIASRT
ncbi:hypothetical protein B0H14DRAFT_3143457 [Mycena olivaceomarginata]|nr:hypothetical protein B0H14DRAFT_3143457 [Mycena olivaceomarginata]